MDLSVHRAMLYIALQRLNAKPPTTQPSAPDYLPYFKALWLGNFITDINQATAFFDALDGRLNPYEIYTKETGYMASKSLQRHCGEWENLISSVWEQEWSYVRGTPEMTAFARLPAQAFDASITPGSIDMICGYNPLDHFDVVDAYDDKERLINPEEEELAFVSPNGEAKLLSKTAYRGVYVHAFKDLISTACMGAGGRLGGWQQLFYLGRATHVLQDFFGHSNYVELLLLLALQEPGLLPPELSEVLAKEMTGSFRSFRYLPDKLESTYVVTGRFDRIDTIWTLLRFLRQHERPEWSDLAASELGARHDDEAQRELTLRVLFGTFSDRALSQPVLRGLLKLEKLRACLDTFKAVIKGGAVKIAALGVRGLAKTESKQDLSDEVMGLLGSADWSAQARFARASRCDFWMWTIEQQLQAELNFDRALSAEKAREVRSDILSSIYLLQSGDPLKRITDLTNKLDEIQKRYSLRSRPRLLPHHTLLAKDHDVSQPENRLVYKIACLLATHVTEVLLRHYVRGDDLPTIRASLLRYYQHPTVFLADPQCRQQLKDWIGALYGQRWWRYAQSVQW